MTVKIYILLLFLTCIDLAFQEECITTPDTIENHLGTKTPYRIVENLDDKKIEYEGCEPLKLWMLVRHGTRNPSTKLVNVMTERLPQIRDLILEHNTCANDYLRNSDLDSFRKWKSKVSNLDEKKLTHEGEDEMLQLAERMQRRFPDILPPVYSNTSFQFKFTSSQRTKQSAKYFVAGLFGKQTVRDVWFPQPLKKDPVLRFYKLCSKWRKDVSKNSAALTERRKFESSQYIKIAKNDVNHRLGLTDQISLDDIFAMYLTCAYETAWNRRIRSPWCSPFSLSTIKVFEFAENLKYYWIDGYGYELTYKQACPAFRDMISHFQNKKEHPKAVVYFTHSGTLLKMLAHLGLYKDEEPLIHSDYKSKKQILWNISKIDSFGTNLALVLFDCGGSKKILTLHQERVIRLPACPDSDFCDISKVLSYYANSVDSCNFDAMCDNEEGK